MPLEIHASGSGYTGFLVIDSVVRRTSSGGVRIAPDLELDEVRDLAREMTLKYAWCDLPRGGGKAGLRMDRSLSNAERTHALEDFGRQLAPILDAGLYYPGMDLGCSGADLQSIYRGAGMAIGTPTDTSYFTAITVASCIEAWAATHPGPSPRRLAIQGFGNVASHLVSILPEDRFRITGLATVEGGRIHAEGFSRPELERARKEHGDALVHHLPGRATDREDVIASDADVFLPAARTRSLGAADADRLTARAVIPIANAPYALGIPARLHDAGVVCLPGFVANCGGVYASSLHDSGVAANDIQALFGPTYRGIVEQLFHTGERKRQSPLEVATEIAERRAQERSAMHESRAHKLRARAERELPANWRARQARTRCQDALRDLEACLKRT